MEAKLHNEQAGGENDELSRMVMQPGNTDCMMKRQKYEMSFWDTVFE